MKDPIITFSPKQFPYLAPTFCFLNTILCYNNIISWRNEIPETEILELVYRKCEIGLNVIFCQEVKCLKNYRACKKYTGASLKGHNHLIIQINDEQSSGKMAEYKTPKISLPTQTTNALVELFDLSIFGGFQLLGEGLKCKLLLISVSFSSYLGSGYLSPSPLPRIRQLCMYSRSSLHIACGIKVGNKDSVMKYLESNVRVIDSCL